MSSIYYDLIAYIYYDSIAFIQSNMYDLIQLHEIQLISRKSCLYLCLFYELNL